MDLIITRDNINAASNSEEAENRWVWDPCCECPAAQALKEQGYTSVHVGCYMATADGHRWDYPYATEQAIRHWRTMKPMTLVLEEQT